MMFGEGIYINPYSDRPQLIRVCTRCGGVAQVSTNENPIIQDYENGGVCHYRCTLTPNRGGGEGD
jgi:hypothetical protein